MLPERTASWSARSLSVKNSWLAYRAGRSSGVSNSSSQMPWRSGWPHAVVFGAGPVAVASPAGAWPDTDTEIGGARSGRPGPPRHPATREGVASSHTSRCQLIGHAARGKLNRSLRSERPIATLFLHGCRADRNENVQIGLDLTKVRSIPFARDVGVACVARRRPVPLSERARAACVRADVGASPAETTGQEPTRGRRRRDPRRWGALPGRLRRVPWFGRKGHLRSESHHAMAHGIDGRPTLPNCQGWCARQFRAVSRLGDDEIWGILAYLRTLARRIRRHPRPVTLPMANASFV